LGVVLLAGSPADAMPVSAKACQKKWEGCATRCSNKAAEATTIAKDFSDKYMACLARACDHQLKKCKQNATGGDGKMTETPPDPLTPKGGDTRGPFIGGILDTGPALSGQGPSGVGSPLGGGGAAPAPSAPPAAGPIIR
jgi:hypothetical protein